jgi:hypothetical protein
MLYRKKFLECKRGGILDIGFIDPYVNNEHTLKTKPAEKEHNLLRALREQYLKREILFPYNFQ